MFSVFAGDSALVSYHPEFASWSKTAGEVTTFFDIEDIPSPQGTLFSAPPSILLIVDKISASDIRQLLYRSENTGESIAVISRVKPRGNFSKDGISIISVEYPKSPSQRKTMIKEITPDISDKNAMEIAKRCDNFVDACIVARQVELRPNEAVNWRKVFIPIPKNAPPWDITNAINEGDATTAVHATRKMVLSTRTTPQALAMQLLGFYSKVVAGSTPHFASIRRGVKDIDGLVDVLSTYPGVVLSSGKLDYGIVAMVAALSAQFKH